MNGMSMPEERHTIAHHLKEHGYNTALLGKAHFEPWLGSPEDFFENRMASENSNGPHRGFDHMELANHFFEGHSHYDKYMDAYPEKKKAFYPMIINKGQNTASKGETGATQVWPMDIPRDIYHTDWVSQRTQSWLGTQSSDKPWFCWMSFPDPHHPWDTPASELHRINWRDVPLLHLYSENRSQLESWLNEKPLHWRGYFDGSLWTNFESPREFVAADITADQVREINAMTHIENELIDEAVGDVIGFLHSKQWLRNTDIFFTTDHGELQGDFGLLFKGPYHIDALMHLPFIWKPAEVANISPAEVASPVGHLDLASTFCAIAGISTPDYCEGKPLPTSEHEAVRQEREIVLTEWDSETGPIDMHLKSIYHRDGFLCTAYEKSHLYEGTEGELYDMREDPDQLRNLWSDPGYAVHRTELTDRLYASLPEETTEKLPRKAPV